MSDQGLKDLQEKLRALGATGEGETAELQPTEPQSRTFKKVTFGAGIEEEIETTPFIQPTNRPYTDPEKFTDRHEGSPKLVQASVAIPALAPARTGSDGRGASRPRGGHGPLDGVSQALTKYLRYRPAKDTSDQYTWGSGDLGARLDKDWAWLKGIWESRGMAVPSEQELLDIKAGKADNN